MIDMNKFMEDKYSFSYEPTLHCNKRCNYCVVLDQLDDNKVINMSHVNTILKKIDKFNKEKPERVCQLELLGGEPLIDDNIFNLLDEALKLDIDIVITTNLMIDDYTLERVRKYLEIPCVRLVASWHSSSKKSVFIKNLSSLYKNEETYSRLFEKPFPKIMASVIIGDPRDGKQEEKFNWMKSMGMQYFITHFKDTENQRVVWEYTGFDKILYENSFSFNVCGYTMDGEFISMKKAEETQLHKLTHKNKALCHPIFMNIDYNGYLECSCTSKWKGVAINLLENDIDARPFICRNSSCDCSLISYKKIF